MLYNIKTTYTLHGACACNPETVLWSRAGWRRACEPVSVGSKARTPAKLHPEATSTVFLVCLSENPCQAPPRSNINCQPVHSPASHAAHPTKLIPEATGYKQHQLSACTQPSIPRCCAGTRMEATGSAMHCGYLRHKRHTKNPSARAPARNGCNRSRGCGTRPEPPSLAYNCMVLEGKVLPKTSEFPSRDPRRLLPALLAVSESLPLRNESGLAPNLRTCVSSNFVCVRACVRVCV